MQVGIILRFNRVARCGVIVGAEGQVFFHENQITEGYPAVGSDCLFAVQPKKPEPGKMPVAQNIRVLSS